MTHSCLVVYNICGIRHDNTERYIKFLQGIKNQFRSFNGDLKVVVSACQPRKHTVPYLKQFFPEFDYLVINDLLTVNITFNHAVLESIKKYGEFDYYTYVTADAMMTQDNDLEKMCSRMDENPNIGMYSAQIDIDSCYAYGLKLGGGRHAIDDERARQEMFKDGTDYIVPVGRACAAHVNMYSSDFFKFYERCCPDIFAGYCTESILTFVNAAIKKHWVISRDILIKHAAGLDGGSAGFDTEGHRARNPRTGGYDHPFVGETLLPIFENEKAISLGLGYEECQNVVIHDDSQFDNNQFCKNEELKDYIKQNLYLSSDQFDYGAINSEYV